MQITIVTIGSTGDIRPYVALGQGIQAAGHHVRIATHDAYQPLVCSRNLDFASLAGNPGTILDTQTGRELLQSAQKPVAFGRKFIAAGEVIMDQLVTDCLRACADADVILFSILSFLISYHVAEKKRVPFLGAFLQPVHATSAFPSILFPNLPAWMSPGSSPYNQLTHSLTTQLAWQLLRRKTNVRRRTLLDLPPLPFRGPFGHLQRHGTPCLYGYSPTVAPPPPDWNDRLHVTGHWFLDELPDWQPPADLVDFLQAGSPPVYIGFGSMNCRETERTTEIALQALRQTGQRGILATGWEGAATDLNDQVFSVGSIPHSWLFPQLAAVVHHGGAGTTAAGLRAGVQSIVVPYFADQTFWGRRVHEIGAGPRPIPRNQLTSERLANAITEAVTDQKMRQNAQKIGASVRSEAGVAHAVEALQGYLTAGK